MIMLNRTLSIPHGFSRGMKKLHPHPWGFSPIFKNHRQNINITRKHINGAKARIVANNFTRWLKPPAIDIGILIHTLQKPRRRRNYGSKEALCHISSKPR